STVQGHRLIWPKVGAGGGDFTLGTAWFGSALPALSSPQLFFRDWTLLEARQGPASALLSRAFPAVRDTSDAATFIWSAAVTRLAVVENGRIAVHSLDAPIDLSGMSEP